MEKLVFSDKLSIPHDGEEITLDEHSKLQCPDNPIIPYIQGDGIGVDITKVMLTVVDAAVNKAYGSTRSIKWMEIYAGQKATEIYGDNEFLPEETHNALRKYKVGIKGPLMTPVGSGIRSLNVNIRHTHNLYICLRPVKYYAGSPSPVKNPEKTDMVIFRENSEGIYTGIEWKAGSDEAKKVIKFLQDEFGVTKINNPQECGVGIKTISGPSSRRLIKAAIDHALLHKKDSVTLVHKGNIMKFTEGAFCEWGYELAREEYGAVKLEDGSGHHLIRDTESGHEVIVKDVIADAFLQQIIINPERFSVIATMNLNGDYISDAIAACVGGIGIAPGGNIGDEVAVFEATHGTAPDIAGKNLANPSSIILSAAMMLRYLNWNIAAQHIENAVAHAIIEQKVTGDFAAMLDGVTALSTSEFCDVLVTKINITSS